MQEATQKQVIEQRTVRVLIVEDSHDDTLAIMHELRYSGYTLIFERVETAEAMLAALAFPWDMVIADYRLPHFTAQEALDILKTRSLDIPFIVLSNSIGREAAIALMRSGAQDCLSKHNISFLSSVVERELREVMSRREQKRKDRAHRQSEQRFQKIFHATPLPMAISSLETHKIITGNERFLELTHAAEETLVGKTWEALGFVPESGTWNTIRMLLREQTALHGIDMRFVTNDHEERALQVWIELIELDDIPCMLCTFQDITERRQVEERTHNQFQRMSALRRIQLTISASLNLDQTLNLLLDHITMLLQVDAAAVLLFDAGKKTLTYAASRGFQQTLLPLQTLQINEGYAGRIVKEHRSLIIPDLRAERHNLLLPFQQYEPFISYYGIPLVTKRQVKGVLEFFHRTPLLFDQEWVTFLEAIGGQAAIAIDNAELFQSLQQSKDALTHSYDATIEGWVRALDLRDKETEGHSLRVTDLTILLARAMELPEDALVHIRRGALLHDIGKIGIPDTILHKPGALTEEEWGIMRQHPKYAYDMLSHIEFLQPALDIPYCHHEKWDGSGYPRKLQGTDIPLSARIFAVVDVWDALSFDRPYRKAWKQQRVLRHIRNLANSHFDPQVVAAFLDLHAKEDIMQWLLVK
jgi:PAS domain S-box-containing protein